MDRATPKKIVNSDSRCFTCSLPSGNQDKVHIFGKSSINFQEIIQTAANCSFAGRYVTSDRQNSNGLRKKSKKSDAKSRKSLIKESFQEQSD